MSKKQVYIDQFSDFSKEGLSAKVISDSIHKDNRITSFELVYPRIIHAELMTHRLFSRNAASSRAIPIMKKIKMIWKNPFVPTKWGSNQKGMQAGKDLDGFKKTAAKIAWLTASKFACVFALLLYKIGLHKQLTNRVLEPFEWYKVVVTATEFDNWFWLRNHKDAQPEIQILAKLMFQCMKYNEPLRIKKGEWHVPYIIRERVGKGRIKYYINDVDYAISDPISLDDAIKVSMSCCAQVSYRLTDMSLEKAQRIYDRLISSTPVHASPSEHQATPIYNKVNTPLKQTQDGVTHLDKKGNLWSGNFKGWVQYRQTLEGNAMWEGYSPSPVILKDESLLETL